MSDTSTGENTTPAFTIAVQYLKAMSIDNSGAPHSFRTNTAADGQDTASDIKIDVQHAPLPDDDEHHEVQILIEVISKNKDDSPRFTIRASYGAVVLARNIPAKDLEMLLNVETPRLLFPYLRSIIATATHESGYPSLSLSPIDFMGVYRQRQEQLANK